MKFVFLLFVVHLISSSAFGVTGDYNGEDQLRLQFIHDLNTITDISGAPTKPSLESSKEEFNKYVESLKGFCKPSSTGDEKKKEFCNSISSKLNLYLPGDHSGKRKNLEDAIKKGSPQSIQDKFESLEDELTEAELNFNLNRCADLDPNKSSDQEKIPLCRQLSQRIVDHYALLQKSADVLKQLQDTDCSSQGPVSEHAKNNLEIAEKVGCSQEEKNKINQNCLKDLTCLVATDLLNVSTGGVAGHLLWATEQFNRNQPKKDNCISTKNSCVVSAVTYAVKALFSNISGLWDLAKSGASWAYNKTTDFFSSLWKVEDATSDKQNNISNLDKQDKEEIKRNPLQWMSNLLSSIWKDIIKFLETDVYCEKWSTSSPKTCVQPFRGFECLGCAKRVTSNCALIGTVLSEVLQIFFSGGAIGVGSAAVKGGKAISTILKASKIAQKLPKLPPKTVLTAAKTGAKTGIKVIANKISVKLAEASVRISKSASNFLNNPLMKPVKKIVKLNDEFEDKLFKAGFKLGSEALDPVASKVVKYADKISGVADNISDASHLKSLNRINLENSSDPLVQKARDALNKGEIPDPPHVYIIGADSKKYSAKIIEVDSENGKVVVESLKGDRLELTGADLDKLSLQGPIDINTIDHAKYHPFTNFESFKTNNQVKSVSTPNQPPSTNSIKLEASNDPKYQSVRVALNKGEIPEDPSVSFLSDNIRLNGKIIEVDPKTGEVLIEDVNGKYHAIEGEGLKEIHLQISSEDNSRILSSKRELEKPSNNSNDDHVRVSYVDKDAPKSNNQAQSLGDQ
jgi:ribosomal protein L24